MNRFISFVRIFYTINLILLGLGLVSLYYGIYVASQHGHGPLNLLAPQNIVIIGLYLLLLISRLLVSRSSNWLWLGLPTILAVYGFIAFSVLYPIFLGY